MQERRIIQGAFALSLLLHLVLVAVTWRIPLISDPGSRLAEDMNRAVEIMLEDDEDPLQMVNVPDRLASEEPPDEEDTEGPKNISYHHSLAADHKIGGDSNTPAADKQGESDMVDIQAADLSGAGGVAFTQQPLPEPDPVPDTAENEKVEGDDLTSEGEWALPSDQDETKGGSEGEKSEESHQEEPQLEDWWRTANPSILDEGEKGSTGDPGFEFDQEATSQSQDGVAMVGNFSLNTYDWTYGPWIKEFINSLYRNWGGTIPPARKMGLISGLSKMQVSITKDGRLLDVQVLEKEGHESLHGASTAVYRAMAPFMPLPDDFPFDVLVITQTLVYPPPLH